LDHHNRFIRSKGGFIDKVNETSTKAGIRLLDWVHTSGPMGLFTVKKPVRKLEDAKRLRLRYVAPDQKVLYEAIGAKGVGIPWPDVYAALQTKMIDGYVHGPETALQFRHTEIFKYFTRLDLNWVSMGISMSESYYQSLSNEQKKVLYEAIEAARKANAKWMETHVPKNLEKLKDAGIEIINPSPEEKERFKSKINAVRNKMAPPPAASSVVGPVIPPRVVLILYGALFQLSIGALFIAGIIPGLLLGLMMMITNSIVANKKKHPGGTAEDCPPFWPSFF
jgi:TRAP-type C4-dicarboxylate transport system substrate-binding protein